MMMLGDWIWQERRGNKMCKEHKRLGNAKLPTKHQTAMVVVVIMLTVMIMTDENGVYNNL